MEFFLRNYDMVLYHNFVVFPAAKGLQSRRSQTFTWQMQVSKWCVGELWICEFEEPDEMATLYRWQPSSTFINLFQWPFCCTTTDSNMQLTSRPSNFILASQWSIVCLIGPRSILAHRLIQNLFLPTDEVDGEVQGEASKIKKLCTWMEQSISMCVYIYIFICM